MSVKDVGMVPGRTGRRVNVCVCVLDVDRPPTDDDTTEINDNMKDLVHLCQSRALGCG